MLRDDVVRCTCGKVSAAAVSRYLINGSSPAASSDIDRSRGCVSVQRPVRGQVRGDKIKRVLVWSNLLSRFKTSLPSIDARLAG